MSTKLKKDPIGLDALEEYLDEASDFSFELRILKMLTEMGISCEHGGQYRDPDTKKYREFDLRVGLTQGAATFVAAIECKSIGLHFPLLVSCVHRRASEAFHQVFFHTKNKDPYQNTPYDIPTMQIPSAMQGMRIGTSALYPKGEPVGKSTAQVGRYANKDDLHVNDAEFFDKWSQALQSLDDLVDQISDDELVDIVGSKKPHWAMALPIVVIPDGTLWTVNYSDNGSKEGPPAQVDRASIFISREYRGIMPGGSYTVSHLEVMTETGLATFFQNYLIRENALLNLARGR
ncbi:hypothetical protein [Ponticaulis profundi]|uniref:Restriction endonuclease n=1 Tax=Ponticaulis profundi TaxID=2665222 RepID=A0ABW1SBU8_9PROT